MLVEKTKLQLCQRSGSKRVQSPRVTMLSPAERLDV